METRVNRCRLPPYQPLPRFLQHNPPYLAWLSIGSTGAVSPTATARDFRFSQSRQEKLKPEQVEIEIRLVEEEAEEGIEESELDEMWSYVSKKTNQRWLWHAIDRRTGQVLAYTFGQRKDEVFLPLKKLLEPFGIKKYCTDGWRAYQRHLSAEEHEIGKRKTQRIERKHLRVRTRIKRLVRKTICFSKSEEMHDLVIGLFINRYEFGLNV